MICAFQVTTTYGIKGKLKAKSFINQFPNKKVLTVYNDKKSYNVLCVRKVKQDIVVLHIEEISTVEQAQELVGQELWVKKEVLPVLKEGYYHNDLIGCNLVLQNNILYGTITYVYNFGAQDIIQFYTFTDKRLKMLPFDKEIFVEINLLEKKVMFCPPSNIDEL